ncbi:MAG: tetratricopeptide repeat protein [Vampirovibrionales bacterium]
MKLCQNDVLTNAQDALLQNAEHAFAQADFSQGQAVLLNAMETHPHVWQFPYALANAILNHADSPEKAVVLLEQASHIAANQIPVWTKLGQAHAENKDVPHAIEALHKAVSLPQKADDTLNTPTLDAYLLLADLLETQQFLDETASALEEAVALTHATHPRAIEVTLKAYQFYVRHDGSENALNVIENRLETHPEEAMLYFLKGVCLERLERLHDALDAYEKATEYGKNAPELHRQMAMYFAQAGDTLKAMTHLVTLLEQLPTDADALEALAHLLAEQGKQDARVQVLERLLDAHPQHAQAWIQAGDAYDLLGQCENAIHAYNQALELTGHRALELRKSLVATALPPATDAEKDALVHRLEVSLKALSISPPRIENPAVDVGITPQHLKEQGVWNESLEALWHQALSGIQRENKPSSNDREARTKTHLVIVTRALNHAEAPTPPWMPVLNALDRTRFQLHWLNIGTNIEAPKGSRFHAEDTVEAVPAYDWQGLQNKLYQHDADALLFSDAQRDIVSTALALGDYAPSQIDLASLKTPLSAPLRPLASMSKRFKEDFGANYGYPLLAVEVYPADWTPAVIHHLHGLLQRHPQLQIALTFKGEAALLDAMQDRLKTLYPEGLPRLAWMALPTNEALKLFQVADAVLALGRHASLFRLQAEAFGTPVFQPDAVDAVDALDALLSLTDAERLALREERLLHTQERFAPTHAERQAHAFVKDVLSCPV